MSSIKQGAKIAKKVIIAGLIPRGPLIILLFKKKWLKPFQFVNVKINYNLLLKGIHLTFLFIICLFFLSFLYIYKE